jgi:hypothetical protein
MQMVRVTVLVLVVRRRTVARLVLVVLVLRRTRVAAVAAIGVVGLQEILRNLIARELVVIQVVAAVRVTPHPK